MSGLSSPSALTIRNNELYIADDSNISKINLTNNTPALTVVASGLSTPNGLAFNGDDLYIGERSGNKISKINVTGANPTVTTVISGLDTPESIFINGNDLYIAETSKISKIDISSNNPTLVNVVNGLDRASGVLVNGNDLYFTETNLEKLSKINISTLSAKNINAKSKIAIYPNPTSNCIQIDGIISTQKYAIYNAQGVKIISGLINENDKISVLSLNSGIYTLKIENSGSHIFIKK